MKFWTDNSKHCALFAVNISLNIMIAVLKIEIIDRWQYVDFKHWGKLTCLGRGGLLFAWSVGLTQLLGYILQAMHYAGI